MRISRTEAWLLVLGAFGISARTGLMMILVGMAMSWAILILGVVLELAVVTGGVAYFAKTPQTVLESELWVLEVLGHYDSTLKPGLHFVLPGVEVIRNKQTTREQFVSVLTKGTLTLDGVSLDFEGELYYMLNPNDPDSAQKATYAFERGPNPEQAIINLVDGTLRSVAGTKEVAFLKNNQDEINRLVQGAIDLTTRSWGFLVTRHVVKELKLPEQIRKAMEQQLIAEREGAARVMAATADKEAKVQTAEGDKQKQVLAAEGDAEARLREAISKKGALDLLIDTLGKEMATQYMLAEESFAALAEIGKGQGTTIIPAGSEGLAQLLALGRGIINKK